jgi:hypothetical protein
MKVILTIMACAVFPFWPAAAQTIPCTDMALVLAIDGSASVSDDEFRFQLEATARALSDPAVVGQMQSIGGVAVAAVLWGDALGTPQVVDWEGVADARGAERFARRLVSRDRIAGGTTDIGVGLMAALDLLDDPRACATRRVINISGDGREVPQFRQRNRLTLVHAVARADRMGVVINGLAITDTDAGLEEYYRRRVITGPGSFVETAFGPADFLEAMKRKLLREVALPHLALNRVGWAGGWRVPG